jgi:RNA polymerase sigma factor (sigma-70 family)
MPKRPDAGTSPTRASGSIEGEVASGQDPHQGGKGLEIPDTPLPEPRCAPAQPTSSNGIAKTGELTAIDSASRRPTEEPLSQEAQLLVKNWHEDFNAQLLRTAKAELEGRGEPQAVVDETLVQVARWCERQKKELKKPLPCLDKAIRRAARKLSAKERKRGARHCQVRPAGSQIGITASPAEELLLKERYQKLKEAIQELNPVEQAILDQYYRQGKTCEEIAAGLGLTNNAVKMRKYRALEKLEDKLRMQTAFCDFFSETEQEAATGENSQIPSSNSVTPESTNGQPQA